MDGAAEHKAVRILTYADYDLPPELRWQIISGLRCVWPEDYSNEHGPRDWIARAEFHPIHLVLARNGFVLAHTVMIWKVLEHEGESYTVYGLSMVFTFPDCQGRGYGLEVVRAGTAHIQRSDADVAMLFCEPRLATFYTKNGWIPMEQATTVIELAGRQFSTGETLLMLFVSDKGNRSRPAFERKPIHFGDTTW